MEPCKAGQKKGKIIGSAVVPEWAINNGVTWVLCVCMCVCARVNWNISMVHKIKFYITSRRVQMLTMAQPSSITQDLGPTEAADGFQPDFSYVLVLMFRNNKCRKSKKRKEHTRLRTITLKYLANMIR